MPTKEELQFDLDNMYAHVVKRDANIEVFQKAIDDEQAGKENDLKIIAVLEAKLEAGNGGL